MPSKIDTTFAAAALAQQIGLSVALTFVAAGLAVSLLAALRYRFQAIEPDELLPAGDWPSPHLKDGVHETGLTLVSVEYWAGPGLADDLVMALQQAKLCRRRTGASSWRVWRDSADPAHVLQEFVVAPILPVPACG